MNSDKVKLLDKNIKSFPDSKNMDDRLASWRIANNWFISLKYALKGILYSLATQRNFRIQFFIAVVALALGIWLKLDLEKLAIIILTVVLVLSLELINTAIESVVDLAIGRKFHPLARIAKDCAAGSVLIAAVGSLLVALILLLPPFLIQLGIQ